MGAKKHGEENLQNTDSIHMRKEKEELLQAENRLFNGGPVVAYKRKPGLKGRFEYISPNISQFGYKQQDFLAGDLDYMALIHPQDVERWRAAAQLQEQTGSLYAEIEFRIRRADGEYRWIYVYKTLLKNESGKISGIQGYILDITERKNMERAVWECKQKYQELVQAANVIIMHLDAKGQILFANEFALRFFGFQSSELLKHPYKNTILPQYESTGRNLWDVFDDMFDNPAQHEYSVLENIKKNGQRVWIEWTNRFTEDSQEGLRLITVGVDITARRRAEISLRLKNERYRRNKLLSDLLENRISENDFTGAMKREGLCLSPLMVCCVVKIDLADCRLQYLKEDREELQAWLETAGDLISARCGGILWQGEQEIAIWKSVLNQWPSLSSWVDKLCLTMQDFLRGVCFVIGVSAMCNEIKGAYRQAGEAALVGPVFNPGKQIYFWHELGMGKLLLAHANSGESGVFITECLGALADMPSAKNEELLCTLQELISGDPIKEIAKRLHMHPKTVAFRKRKIEQILGKKLDDAETRLNIAAALKLRQLRKKLAT